MSVRINTNVEALNAQRNLGITSAAFGKSVEKLSSGLRINRAADDAAGLAISERLRAQVRGLNQAQRNAQDGISLVQTAEGALNESHSILQRMRELVVQAGTSTVGANDKLSIKGEMDSLNAELDRIATTTKYNGTSLLTGGFGSTVTATTGTVATGFSSVSSNGAAAATYTLAAVAGTASGLKITMTNSANADTLVLDNVAIPAGLATTSVNFSNGVSFTLNASASIANVAGKTITVAGAAGSLLVGADGTAAEKIGVSITTAMTSAGLGTSALDVTAVAFDSAASIATIDAAIGTVSNTRAGLGAAQNRLEHTIANLGVASENMSASESRIRDLDVAAEMVSFTKTQILQQAGTAILAQANQAPQSILSLLK
jgi:flagellin